MHAVLYDAAGHHRSPVTMPGFHEGRTPRNKGRRYPADPPTVEEIVAVMRAAGNGADGARLRALIVILWRAGNGRVTQLSVTRAFIGVAPKRESGCKQLHSLERLSADLRVLAPDVVVILGAPCSMRARRA